MEMNTRKVFRETVQWTCFTRDLLPGDEERGIGEVDEAPLGDRVNHLRFTKSLTSIWASLRIALRVPSGISPGWLGTVV